jgi:geranylgeranyl reductase family protein
VAISRHDCDAVVVGGGPAGAAAAARLAAQGFTTILIDRATFPRDKTCGDFVGPAALTELADLGVSDTEAFGATNRIGKCALYINGEQLGALAIPEVSGLPGYGRVIPRRRLDAWVLDGARYAGATVFDGRKVTAVEQAPDAVTIHGDSGAGPWQLRSRLLIGADGSSSTVAHTLRGTGPAHQDRIMAVRAYFDDVGGPDDQADICVGGDSLPGYAWLFPCGGGRANVGVGMVMSTYPQTGHNLRELLLQLIAEDPAMQHRLRGARIRGRIVGWPLTTYNPRLPLVGDRIMLIGDAAGLINPLNGEGIQYALHSARWAADVAADRLSSDHLDAASLARYEQFVHQHLGQDMAFSRLVVQLIRNRALNPVWLRALRIMAARASIDADYAYRVGCVVTGLAPATTTLGLSVATKTVRQAMISPRAGASTRRPRRSTQARRPAPDPSGSKIGGTNKRALTPRQFAEWAAGVGRVLTELTTQPRPSSPRPSPMSGVVTALAGAPAGPQRLRSA